MHLVGFIVRIFYDARSSECQKTPDDGQKNCPKHVEFYFKNKFEKLVHLVGVIIRIMLNRISIKRVFKYV